MNVEFISPVAFFIAAHRVYRDDLGRVALIAIEFHPSYLRKDIVAWLRQVVKVQVLSKPRSVVIVRQNFWCSDPCPRVWLYAGCSANADIGSAGGTRSGENDGGK